MRPQGYLETPGVWDARRLFDAPTPGGAWACADGSSLAPVSGPLHAECAGPRAQGGQSDRGGGHPNCLRLAPSRSSAAAVGRGRESYGAAMDERSEGPFGRREWRTDLYGPSIYPLDACLLHQPAGEAESGSKTPDECGGNSPQPGCGAATGRLGTDRVQR